MLTHSDRLELLRLIHTPQNDGSSFITDTELIDLSIGIEPDAASEPLPGSVEYYSHEEGAELLAGSLHDLGIDDIEAADFPDGTGLT